MTALLVFLVGIARRILPLARTRRLTAAQRKVMTTYATYYRPLDPESQVRFERVVTAFVNDKEWKGSGMEVVDEMKVMIGACAAQLLHGFPDVRLKHFNRILVCQGPYRSGNSTQVHMGEVRPAVGLIIISWSDFVQGYVHPRNTYNVGLHEMAHALWFENAIINGEDHFLEATLLKKWIALAHAEIVQIQGGRHSFLRSYAGTNEAEFFAVAVEYFFEQPKEFRAALPELYGTLGGLMRQAPAADVGPARATAARPRIVAQNPECFPPYAGASHPLDFRRRNVLVFRTFKGSFAPWSCIPVHKFCLNVSRIVLGSMSCLLSCHTENIT